MFSLNNDWIPYSLPNTRNASIVCICKEYIAIHRLENSGELESSEMRSVASSITEASEKEEADHENTTEKEEGGSSEVEKYVLQVYSLNRYYFSFHFY